MRVCVCVCVVAMANCDRPVEEGGKEEIKFDINVVIFYRPLK